MIRHIQSEIAAHDAQADQADLAILLWHTLSSFFLPKGKGAASDYFSSHKYSPYSASAARVES
jgi:hypothetical protein